MSVIGARPTSMLVIFYMMNDVVMGGSQILHLKLTNESFYCTRNCGTFCGIA